MAPKSFNIILNSSDTTSFNGYIYNGYYYVNFTQVIAAEELAKPWLISLKLVSKQTATLPVSDAIYLLHLNLLTRAHVQQNRNMSQICAVLSKIEETSTVLATAANIPFIFQTGFGDNPPVYIDDLRNISQIQFKITTQDMTTVFAAMPDYVCMLFFEQA
jgi:hypothetical protein